MEKGGLPQGKGQRTGADRWTLTPVRWLGALPLIWFCVFVALPLLVALRLSVSVPETGIPPYSSLWEWQEGKPSLVLHAHGYAQVFQDPLYVRALLGSLRIALLAASFSLLIGFPLALAIYDSKPKTRLFLLFLVMLPFWTSFLVRIYAWVGLLSREGYLNRFLGWLGWIDQPLRVLNTEWAIYIGIVYAYLPFMVLPIYAALMRVDRQILEAAADLGASPWRVLREMILPLSLPGVLAGFVLVFVPAVGEFAIPEILGGSDTLMIGRVLWDNFFFNRDWPTAGAIAVVLAVLFVAPVLLISMQFRKFHS